MRINLLVSILFILAGNNVYSQTIIRPNFGVKSHETLEIVKVVITDKSTILYLVIENRITGGTFCADRNIYILKPDGTKLFLKQSKGIPVCPDAYKFKFIGERLNFTLTFPPLAENEKWFDLIEDCAENCFWIYGVTIDNELNNRLEGAFIAAETGTPDENIKVFSNILKEIDSQNQGVEGLLYINIINAARENSDRVTEQVFMKRLVESGAPRLEEYIKYLNGSVKK